MFDLETFARLCDPDEFIAEVERRQDGYKTLAAAYRETEDDYYATCGRNRYASYSSFRYVRWLRKNRRKL